MRAFLVLALLAGLATAGTLQGPERSRKSVMEASKLHAETGPCCTGAPYHMEQPLMPLFCVPCLAPFPVASLPAAYADAQLSKVDGGESSGTDAWASEHKPDFDRRLLSESIAQNCSPAPTTACLSPCTICSPMASFHRLRA